MSDTFHFSYLSHPIYTRASDNDNIHPPSCMLQSHCHCIVQCTLARSRSVFCYTLMFPS